MRAPTLWRSAQRAGVVLTALLIAGLVLRPQLALDILWSAIIPVLPAVFLVNVQLWRNVCPLATLTLLPGDGRGSRRLTEGAVRAGTVAGILLLLVLVPARRVVFNTNGPVLALTVTAVAALAILGGLAYKRKAGFCNAICPVLPVERLYGQRPLLRVPHVRCTTCLQCTERGCIDRSHLDSVRTALGARRNTARWILSPFGIFASAFPGFIVAYYTSSNTAPGHALETYARVLQGMVVSFTATFLVVRVLLIDARTGVPLLGAVAAALYYWFASSAVAATWGFGEVFTWTARGAALLLVQVWLFKALYASPGGNGNGTANSRALPVV